MTGVTIDRIAAGGDGVGRLPDGMTVFVPRTAPRDVARIEVVARKRRYARGQLIALDRAAEGRVEPRCQHYRADACGGCQLQHLDYPHQVAAKQGMVRDAVRRIGRRDPGEIPIVPATRTWRYRSRITVAAGIAGDHLGFHRYDRPGAVFDLRDCLIASESLMDLWTRLRRHRGLLPPGLEAVGLREDREGGRHVVLHGGTPPIDPAPLADAIDAAQVCWWWLPAGGAARVLRSPDGRAGTGFPAVAFEQGNRGFADAIRQQAVSDLQAEPGEVVWDLYGGAGDAARLLAGLGASVWSVDSDRRAVTWARERPAVPAPAVRPRYLASRVEDALPRLPAPSAAVLNPPRAGAGRPVTRALNQLAARGTLRRVAYVSCDPATLARDLTRLPALALRRLTAFDLFPQTSHVECLAILEAG